MKQSIERTQRDNSLSFKLTIIEQVGKGEITYRQAQECSTILKWLRKYCR